jgi:hypothetical protein
MNWGLFMKTKIIYISGSEIFNMNDVRDAFETVRKELGLTHDTILFGVPVDKEDALGEKFENVKTTPVNVSPVDTESTSTVETPIDDVVDIQQDIVEVEPKAKPKRAKKKVVEIHPEIEEIVEPEPQIDITEPDNKPDDAIIPILSVLGGEKTTEPETVLNDTDLQNDIIDAFDEAEETDEVETPTAPISFDAADIDDEIPTVEPEPTKIINTNEEDDSLEKLLQSVQSLHEDKDETIIEPVATNLDETDLTLEKLANEFVENQDKIVNTTKSSARGGRIGKLKNILPFKKVKHNDSGLMGDLFGWAGVAANDEEFGIPDFFPTAAKK